jgi:hypothetical protein
MPTVAELLAALIRRYGYSLAASLLLDLLRSGAAGAPSGRSRCSAGCNHSGARFDADELGIDPQEDYECPG